MFLVPRRSSSQELLRYPLADQRIVSSRVDMSGLPSFQLVQVVQGAIRDWTSCFTSSAIDQSNEMRADLARDEAFAAVQGHAHRPRRDASRLSDHVILSMEDYSPIVREHLRAGFIIRFSKDGHPRLVSVQPTKPEDWGRW